MDPDLSALDELLDDRDADGYLIDASSEHSDQRYLSGFDAHDPFFTLYTGETHLLVSGLEYGRARKEARAETVSRYADYDYLYGSPDERMRMLADFLADHDVSSTLAPARFPLATADGLRDREVSVEAETEDVLTEIRAVKTDEEIGYIREAQRANEAAMAAAEELLRAASVESGRLLLDGEALTSERVTREIERTLLEHDHALDETIVAGGAQGADPHDRGSGPLPANQPIVIDVFPRSKATKYNADMTRTFVVGEPTEEAVRRYEITEEALDAALAAVEPGVTGADVHDAVCDVYEGAGYATLRSDPGTEVGFIHSTGHGIGLDVHELPSLSPSGGELEPGHVITVEPGLYHPDVGGIRIEDLVVVTEEGYENLTRYERRFVV
ncbi:M24 family metallopeptidase [Natronorarus salvus]|uniref:M24 family metallopeptidase n=1 Tax=Natronorarus salvus TaxID=3117733 RepID=UPI002F25FFA7